MALGAGPADEVPAMIVRSYDLRGVAPLQPSQNPALRLLPYGITMNMEVPGVEETEGVDVNVIVDAIMGLMGSEFEYEGRGLHVENGDRLVVAAPRDVQEKVQRALTAFEQAFSSGVDVSVDVLTVKPDVDLARLVPSAVIGSAEADRLLGDLKGVTEKASSQRVRLQLGRSSVIDLSRQIAFVRDYDVEIAQSAATADPIVDTARIGTQLVLRGAPAADGISLAVFVRRADLAGDVRKREFPISAGIVSEHGGLAIEEVARDLQSPDIQFRSLALNTFLRDGQALVATISVDGPKPKSQEVLVLRLAGERTPVVQTLRLDVSGTDGTMARELTLVDASLLAPSVLEIEPLVPSIAGLSYSSPSGGDQPVGFLFARLHEPSLDAAVEALRLAFPDYSFPCVRSLIVNVHEVSSGGENPQIKPVALELAPKQVVRSVTLALKRSGRSARICIPVRVGEVSAGVAGLEQMVVSDYDVDVANDATVPNPVTQAIVDGVGFWLRSSLTPSGDLALEVKLKANLRVDDGRESEVRSPFYKVLDLPVFDTLWIDERLSFGGGTKEITLGDAAASLQVRVD
jgi:hypothetical protein